MESFEILIFIGVGLLFFICIGFLIFHGLRKKARNKILTDPDFAEAFAIEDIPHPTEQDLAAETIIKEETDKIWKRIGVDTSIHPQFVFTLCIDMNLKIAGIYFPDSPTPELMATVHDLNELIFRISQNIRFQLEGFPFNKIKDLNVDQLLRLKDTYDRFNSNELFQFFKSHFKYYKFGSHFWTAFNATNPWFWGRRMFMTVTREALIRYFLVMVLTTVGNEARRVYGNRLAPTRKEAVEIHILKEVYEGRPKPPVPEDLKFLFNLILQNKRLNADLKIKIMKDVLNDQTIQMKPADHLLSDENRERIKELQEKLKKTEK